MGVSTDAILFFGFVPENAEYFEMPEGSPYEDLYDAVSAWNTEHKPPRPDTDDYQAPEMKAWRDACDEWERTSPAHIVQGDYCCREEPYTYIAVGRLHTRCRRGDVEEIPMDLLTRFTPEDLYQMTLFCKWAGIPYPENGCSWKLVSWWG